MILYKKRLIFIHIPKCAGSSIESAFNYIDDFDQYKTDSFGPDHRPIRALEEGPFSLSRVSNWENFTETRRRLRDRQKPKPNPMKNLLVTQQQYDTFYKFSFVRNPWARAYSMYKHIMREEHKQRRYNMHKLKDKSFKGFLMAYAGKKDLQPQTYWLKDFNGNIAMDFVGRFENLATDFEQVCSELKMETIKLPHIYKGNGDDYRQHYDQEMIDKVADVYAEEIALFDYAFE